MKNKHEKVKQAAAFAAAAHEGQTRRNGEPYYNHVARVATLVSEVTTEVDLICAAFLHDTIEDCEVKQADLEAVFGQHVAQLVAELTSDELLQKALGKEAYMIKKFHAISAEAALVKLCDTLNNMSETEKEKQATTYAKIQERLQKDPPPYWSVIHQRLSKQILATFEQKLGTFTN